MNKSYDRDGAKRLVPLLESISAEIAERLASIRDLESRMGECKGGNRNSLEARELQAELALNRRELRHAREELSDLGCVQDEADPLQVRIPGRDGDLDHGFCWLVGETGVNRIEPDASAA
jgi:hypothetical protein